MPTLADYRKQVTATHCRWCGTALPDRIAHYDHRDGWVVDGMADKQWLYITCSKCGYDWSLWKIGVKRCQD